MTLPGDAHIAKYGEIVGGLNRPAGRTLTAPPEPVHHSGLPELTPKNADRLMIAGVWVPIVKGSFRPLPGLERRVLRQGVPETVPMVAFMTPEGDMATVAANEVIGWAPLDLDGGSD